MSSHVRDGATLGALTESSDFTYRLVKSSTQQDASRVGGQSGSPLVHRNLDCQAKYGVHGLDVAGPGNLVHESVWESLVKLALEKVMRLVGAITQEVRLLESEVMREAVVFMEEYVRQKVNLKMDALAEFFGVLCDTEKQTVFKALLRTYSNKLRVLDKQELDKMKHLYRGVLGKTIATFRSSVANIRNNDIVNLIKNLDSDAETTIQRCVASPDFEEALHFLHEASLFLVLGYHSQSFGLTPNENRSYKVKLFDKTKMLLISGMNSLTPDSPKVPVACLEITPAIKVTGRDVPFKSLMIRLGDPASLKPVMDSPCSLKTLLEHLYPETHPVIAQSHLKTHCNNEQSEDASNLQRMRDEKLITFEGSSGNVKSRYEGRQKKSVTFSDKDSVFEFEPTSYNKEQILKKEEPEMATANDASSKHENKENRMPQASTDRQAKKVMNLKELQLNPKHFIGKRHNKPPNLRLLQDSEESIESMKPAEKRGITKRSFANADSILRDTTNTTSIFKNLSISKEDIQNKVAPKASSVSKRDSKEAMTRKRSVLDNTGEAEAPPTIKIQLSSSDRSKERIQPMINFSFDKAKNNKVISPERAPRDIFGGSKPSTSVKMLNHRSSSAHSLNRLKQTKSNMDFMNQLSRKSILVMNVSDIADSSSARFGRSLSAGRRMLATMLNAGSKDQTGSSISDLKHHSLLGRDDKMASKSNVMASKLNFLNYDKQSPSSQYYSMKAKDKGGPILDLGIYQKILAGRSKITPQASKHSSGRIR